MGFLSNQVPIGNFANDSNNDVLISLGFDQLPPPILPQLLFVISPMFPNIITEETIFPTFMITSESLPFSVGNFNGNSISDLAIVETKNNRVSIVPDTTLGNLTTFPVGIQPVSIVTGDFSNDNNLDLAVLNYIDPQSVRTIITDFTSGEDVIGLDGIGITAVETFSDNAGLGIRLLGGPTLALLSGVSVLNEEDFMVI